jgi:hypothetical protein
LLRDFVPWWQIVFLKLALSSGGGCTSAHPNPIWIENLPPAQHFNRFFVLSTIFEIAYF